MLGFKPGLSGCYTEALTTRTCSSAAAVAGNLVGSSLSHGCGYGDVHSGWAYPWSVFPSTSSPASILFTWLSVLALAEPILASSLSHWLCSVYPPIAPRIRSLNSFLSEGQGKGCIQTGGRKSIPLLQARASVSYESGS